MRPTGLTASEKQVRTDFLAGGRTSFAVGDPAVDDPAAGATWGPERTLRAELIRRLIDEAGDRRAPLRVVGARVAGPLDLEYLELGYSLSFASCYFEDDLDLHDTRLRRLNLRGTRLAGLNASLARVEATMVLHKTRIQGRVRLDHAEIGGELLITDAVLSNPGEVALRAERVRVGGDLMLWGTTIEGAAVLRDAKAVGIMSLERATLSNPGGMALDAARLQVGSDLIGDDLHAEGKIRFSGSDIKGLLRLANAKLNNPGDTALEAYQAKIGADVQFYRGFEADGLVRVTGARIEGHARFDAATLHGDGKAALDAQYAEIGGSMRCQGMRAAGEVRFTNARVANDVDFREAVVTLPGGGAGTGTGSGAAGITAGAAGGSAGSVPGSGSIAGSGSGSGSIASSGSGSPGAAADLLLLGNLRAGELSLRFAAPPAGGIHLANAQVGVLNDDPAAWAPHFCLDGFVYDRITEPGPVTARIAWLARESGGYRPGPYEQLATVYRRQGLDGEARRVLLAKQRARRRTLSLAARPWGFVQDATVGYGYRPERALGWLAALLITGCVVFGVHHPVPLGPDKAPPFNALIYSLDLLLPVINFGQGHAYTATGGYQWLAYLLTAAGWILATTIAAGVARAVNRA
ncbi:hypothetical protein [Catenulispora pinisilvae]|uniref:hypothetical protein n=1 Tax=Catenulispora pinisilvae TaxID=2705253 RepID=UPI0018923CB5|nr:hypothetical protein [Catenulispora pinisilvae]